MCGAFIQHVMTTTMSTLQVVESIPQKAVPVRRQVSIKPDGSDFVVAFQPDNVVVFRHRLANELRVLCRKLRWEIVSDATANPHILPSCVKAMAIGPTEFGPKPSASHTS